jgi:hypothetical protein
MKDYEDALLVCIGSRSRERNDSVQCLQCVAQIIPCLADMCCKEKKAGSAAQIIVGGY